MNRCLKIQDIKGIVEEVTNHYQEKGYITTQAFLPEQDISSGTLIVQVLEGALEDWQFEKNELAIDNMSAVFPLEKGETLNLRALEQGLDQINRLQSMNTTLQLLPGALPGTSLVALNNKPSKPWRAVFTADNGGQRSTGREQLAVQLGVDNPLGYADFFQVRVQRNWQQEGKSGESESASFHWDVPFGNWNIDLDASLFRYASQVEGLNTDLTSTGTSRSQSIRISRLLDRDSDSTDKLTFSVNRRDSQNFLEDVRLETSSRVLASATASWQRTGFFYRGQYTLGLAWHQGIDRLGTVRREGDEAPEPLFRKQTLSASVFKQFDQRFGASLSYSSSVQFQRSKDTLFSSEQISIGGRFSVRGYDEDNLSGSTGGYLRQDFRLSWNSGWSANLGADIGRTKDIQQGWQSLKGAGLGLAFRKNAFTVHADYGQAFNVPSFLDDDGRHLFFSINIEI